MAAKQMNQLSTLSTVADADLLLVYDVDEGGSEKTKTITYSEFETQISGAVGGGGSNPESLYYSGALALETISGGVKIYDAAETENAQFFHSGTNFTATNNEWGGWFILQVHKSDGSTYNQIQMASSYVTIGYAGDNVLRTRTGGLSVGAGGNDYLHLVGSATTNNIISDAEGAVLSITGNKTAVGDSPMASFDPDGAAALYNAGDKVFETYSSRGVAIADGELLMYGAGSKEFYIIGNLNDSDLSLWSRDSGGTARQGIKIDGGGSVALNYLGEQIFYTQPDSVRVSANGVTLEIYCDEDSYIRNYFHGGTIGLKAEDAGGSLKNLFLGDPGGASEIFHAGDKQFGTVVDGVEIPSDSFMYFGDTTTSGSWRMGISGEDFIHQKYDGADWVTKQTVVG